MTLRRRAIGLIGSGVLSAAMVIAGVAGAGCGDVATPGREAASPASPATRSVAPMARADIMDAAPITRSDEPLDLPYREYRLAGQLHLGDLTGGVAAFQKNAGKHQELWLMDLSSGRVRRVFAKGTTGGGASVISAIRLSDSWIAWEEVGPGDDLVEEADWRLYAAPLQRSSLSIGARRLIASASNHQASRPLFDLSGSRLVWMSNTAGSAGVERRSLVMLRDLKGGRARVLHRATGVLVTIGYSDDRVVVTESPNEESPGAATVTIAALDAQTGEQLARLEVPSEFGLSHWPAWRNGWVAWAPFPSADSTYPELYFRDAAGSLYVEEGSAVDPTIVGDYVFYKTERPGPNTVYEVRALRLTDLTSTILTSGDPETGTWWHGPVGAPSIDHRYVVYGDNTLAAERYEEWQTVVRVYDVP